MGKSENIESWIESRFGALDRADPAQVSAHPCFRAYLHCFNAGDYYEAHDALEHLWLQTPPSQPDYVFFKALIQFAGAYVHLKHHRAQPQHRIHARRLYPAAKLFKLAAKGLGPFPPVHHAVPVALVRARCGRLTAELALSAYRRNPWHHASRPGLALLGQLPGNR